MYSREIDDQILTLSASGWTYDFTFVLFDYETESMWYHMPGENGLRCIAGEFADRKLEEFTSVYTRWADWAKQFPGSKYLKAP